jgi:hypothetical protein
MRCHCLDSAARTRRAALLFLFTLYNDNTFVSSTSRLSIQALLTLKQEAFDSSRYLTRRKAITRYICCQLNRIAAFVQVISSNNNSSAFTRRQLLFSYETARKIAIECENRPSKTTWRITSSSRRLVKVCLSLKKLL